MFTDAILDVKKQGGDHAMYKFALRQTIAANMIDSGAETGISDLSSLEDVKYIMTCTWFCE